MVSGSAQLLSRVLASGASFTSSYTPCRVSTSRRPTLFESHADKRQDGRQTAWRDVSVLTGDADGGLTALGGSQVAPGHTQTPVVLRAVEVLHLLSGHVDHHVAHLQP